MTAQMLHIFLKLTIKLGRRQQMIEFLKRECEVARNHEPGTLRIEYFQHPDNDDVIFLHKVFRDTAAIEEHKSGEFYLAHYPKILDECLESAERIFDFTNPAWTMDGEPIQSAIGDIRGTHW